MAITVRSAASVMPSRCNAATATSPATTPAAPSKLPPWGTEFEMRAHQDGRRGAVAAGQSHVKIGGGVALDLQPEPRRFRGDRRMCSLLPRSVRIARDAGRIGAVGAQPLEQRGGALAFRLNGGAERLSADCDHDEAPLRDTAGKHDAGLHRRSVTSYAVFCSIDSIGDRDGYADGQEF